MPKVDGPRHVRSLSAPERLLFEAGVKLGGIFHQYIGVPVTNRTAAHLASTIERAVGLQPYVRSVRVKIRPSRGGPAGTGRFAYQYLTAEMLDATVTVADGPWEVVARLAYAPRLRYPEMRVIAVRRARAPRRPARRSGRTSGASARYRARSAG
jgi:hypothetical protein